MRCAEDYEILLGDEATGLGAIHGGVSGTYGYPGTPATEIFEFVEARTRKTGDVVYTYRDPCSYVEIPCNGCEGGHRPARPMKVVEDAMGSPWLCDSAVAEADEYTGVCWDCGSLAFTRS